MYQFETKRMKEHREARNYAMALVGLGLAMGLVLGVALSCAFDVYLFKKKDQTAIVVPTSHYYVVGVTGCSGSLDGRVYTTGVLQRGKPCTVTALLRTR